MTKTQKIAALSDAMGKVDRDDGSEVYCFTDSAPDALKNVFFHECDNNSDNDYRVFSDAIDIMEELYQYENDPDDVTEDTIQEHCDGSASVYTATRLSYINTYNQDEITDIMRECGCDIQTACATWYDREVERYALAILAWINDDDE